jgi:hypothetical protein
VSSGQGRRDREAAERAHVVTRRAIQRLDLLELFIISAGVGLSMAGGVVVAWALNGITPWDFRSTWIGASLFLFVLSGSLAIAKIRKDARADAELIAAKRNEDDG